MKTTVLVHKRFGKWILSITIYDQNGMDIVTVIEKDKLIEVIDIACLLQLHIDNEVELPLRAYANTAA